MAEVKKKDQAYLNSRFLLPDYTKLFKLNLASERFFGLFFGLRPKFLSKFVQVRLDACCHLRIYPRCKPQLLLRIKSDLSIK